MTVRTRLLGLCTGLAFAFVMTTAAVAVTKVDPNQKSHDKEAPSTVRHPQQFAAGVIQGAVVLPGPKVPQIILYDQTDFQGVNAFNSQDFETFYDQYDDQAADDFVVTGAGWTVTTVTTPGVYFNGPGPAPSLHITFYDDDGFGLPGSPVCDYPVVTTFTGAATGSFTATLSPVCSLTPGTKWVSVVANMDFLAGGQWGWAMRTVFSGNPAAWQNPGGGFGSPCDTWGSRAFLCATDTNDEPDQVFRLDGSFSSCNNNADCQDGDLCNGSEICVASACQPGTPVNCNDGFFCTIDTCAPATGLCSHGPNTCSDSNGCTADSCNEATDTCSHFSPPPLHLCNTGSISIPDSGTATPYPSTITVSGLSPVGGLCSVELNGITHTFPSDIDMLVVGPGTPQNAVVMSDTGGSTPAAGVNLTLIDSAAASIPTPLVSGTFKPTNTGTGDAFPGAPASSGQSTLGVFDGTDPNGDWKLFVVDDVGGDQGAVAGGWCINIVVTGCTSNSQCNDGNACNGVETCVSGNCTAGTPVNCDDGLFCTDDTCAPATGVCSHTAKTCSDNNACTSDFCDEAGDVCVNTNASVHICNTGAIAIPTLGVANPYPSPINVSGQPTTGSVCSVELKGITHTFPDDIDILLARTSGPNALIMSDVGGGGDVNNINLTLTDGAASSMPDAGPLVSGTFRPTNSNSGGADTAFPAPAPAISGPSVLSTFDGQNPNGVWNLWVRDEFAGDSGSIAGGWCLNLVVSSCTTNAECQDANICNGFETCVAGSCTPGTPVDCSDGLFCTLDTCDPPTGTCGHPPNPCADADGCTNDSCDEGADACVHTPACIHVCNTGPITINDSTTPPTIATPYPSIINVSGGSGLFTLVSVELKGIAHTFPDDIDIQLAAPNVANGAIIMSDVGGSAVASNVNLVLTDGAPPIPDAGPLVSGTFAPTNVNPGTGTEAWPAPAPLPSASSALSQFNGSNPNGDWKLFVVDDQGIDQGSIAGGWCLNYKSSCSSPADCNDGNACTNDVCDATGACSHTTIACNDGNACNGVETCDPASGCVPGTPPVCNDGNACNGVETCDPASGCVPGTPLSCNDGNACNGVETCNPASGCVGGTPVTCAPPDQCHTAGVCDPGTGLCGYGNQPNGTTCDDGNSGTSGDSCQNGVCVGSGCTSSNDPKTKGWYKSLCHNEHSGDSLTDADAACVGANSSRFAGMTTVAQLCAVYESSHQTNCDRGDEELLTLELNICKQRVCPAQSIDSDCGNNGTVAQSENEADTLLSNPSRSNAQCDHAECLAKEISNGHALELNTLATRREVGNVRLNWQAPLLDDGTGQPRGYKIWRRAIGSTAPFVLIGTTNSTPTFLDTTAGSGSWQYDVTPTY